MINKISNLFKKLIKDSKLSHAYLLWGYGDHDQKAQSAVSVVELLEPRPFVDCLVMRPIDGIIGIDGARDAIRFLWQRPVRSVRKTLVVTDAAALTTEAQGAFLKIVEEPPAHGLIIGIARDPSVLLPTLLSRFQKIYCGNYRSPTSIGLEVGLPNIEKFLTAAAAQRKEMIKRLVEDEDEKPGVVEDFMAGLMAELDKNPIKNYDVLKELTHRLMLMSQFTTNRKLQLEAIASKL